MERMYRARIVETIYWKDKTLQPGTEIEVTGRELGYLGPCAVSIAPVRQEPIETMETRAPENTMRQRARR